MPFTSNHVYNAYRELQKASYWSMAASVGTPGRQGGTLPTPVVVGPNHLITDLGEFFITNAGDFLVWV